MTLKHPLHVTWSMLAKTLVSMVGYDFVVCFEDVWNLSLIGAVVPYSQTDISLQELADNSGIFLLQVSVKIPCNACSLLVMNKKSSSRQQISLGFHVFFVHWLSFTMLLHCIGGRGREGIPSGDSTDLQPSHIAWYLKVQCKDFMKFTDFENFELPCPTRTIAMVGLLIFSSEWSHILYSASDSPQNLKLGNGTFWRINLWYLYLHENRVSGWYN